MPGFLLRPVPEVVHSPESSDKEQDKGDGNPVEPLEHEIADRLAEEVQQDSLDHESQTAGSNRRENKDLEIDLEGATGNREDFVWNRRQTGDPGGPGVVAVVKPLDRADLVVLEKPVKQRPAAEEADTVAHHSTKDTAQGANEPVPDGLFRVCNSEGYQEHIGGYRKERAFREGEQKEPPRRVGHHRERIDPGKDLFFQPELSSQP